MTFRGSKDESRKAPNLARLQLGRKTVRDLTESEAQAVSGGQVFGPRPVSFGDGDPGEALARADYCGDGCSAKCTSSI